MFYSKELKVLMLKQVACLGAPLTYFTDGEGGGGCQSDFFWV